MKKSLRNILVLTVATTALSTIPGYSAEELTDGGPKKPAMRTVPIVESKGCGCWTAFKSLFTRKNIQKALDIVDEVADITEVGLKVAGAATGDQRLANIATGIEKGKVTLNKMNEDLSGPGGVSVTGVLKAVNDGADGALDITSQVAPGSTKAVSNVVKVIKASDDAASTLVGDGHPTATSVLNAGGKIAGIIAGQTGDHDAEIAENLLDGMGQALKVQQSVNATVNTVNPLPSTDA